MKMLMPKQLSVIVGCLVLLFSASCSNRPAADSTSQANARGVNPAAGAGAGGGYQLVQLFDAARSPGDADGTGVVSVAYSPRGESVATSGRDDSVRIFETNSTNSKRNVHASPGHLVFSPDSRMLAVAEYVTGTVGIMMDVNADSLDSDPSRGVDVRLEVPLSQDSVPVFSADSRFLSIVAVDLNDVVELRTWQIDNRKETVSKKIDVKPQLAPSQVQATGIIQPLASLTPNGATIAVGKAEHIYLWNAQSAEFIRRLDLEGHVVSALRFSPDSRLLAAGDDQGNVEIWDVAAGNRLQRLVITDPRTHGPANVGGQVMPHSSLCFSADGRHFAATIVTSEGSLLGMWDAAKWSSLPSLLTNGQQIWCVAFSSDGARVALGMNDGTLSVRQLR